MKKLYSALIVASLMLAILPVAMVMAVSVGSGTTPIINTEKFPPQVFMCDSRVVLDDNTEPGRLCNNNNPNSPNTGNCIWNENVSSYQLNGTILYERINNYAFEGEKVVWDVLVVDKNGINKVQDVFATVGDSQGAGNNIEANCVIDKLVYYYGPNDPRNTPIPDSCNAKIQGEEQPWAPKDNTAAFYKCILTVETPESMYGQYWVTVEAVDLDGLSGTMAENEYWFFNPVIALSIDGSMTFDNVRPGTDAYSSTMLVGNDADDSSGVLMDMFISGTDFYDSASSGAMCPTTNQLSLSNFRYFATSGAYSTELSTPANNNLGIAPASYKGPGSDAEGYKGIIYGIGFNNPSPFYDHAEIIPSTVMTGPYYAGNLLAPGAEMALTFKLSLPEPCNGNFDTGSIYFWGEAI